MILVSAYMVSCMLLLAIGIPTESRERGGLARKKRRRNDSCERATIYSIGIVGTVLTLYYLAFVIWHLTHAPGPPRGKYPIRVFCTRTLLAFYVSMSCLQPPAGAQYLCVPGYHGF